MVDKGKIKPAVAGRLTKAKDKLFAYLAGTRRHSHISYASFSRQFGGKPGQMVGKQFVLYAALLQIVGIADGK
jgi:hypothetical protein